MKVRHQEENKMNLSTLGGKSGGGKLRGRYNLRNYNQGRGRGKARGMGRGYDGGRHNLSRMQIRRETNIEHSKSRESS